MGASNRLEKEDHSRDASFNKAMHGSSATATGGVAAMFAKNRDAKQAALDEYFKHFDNKDAANETTADREVCDPEPLLYLVPLRNVGTND